MQTYPNLQAFLNSARITDGVRELKNVRSWLSNVGLGCVGVGAFSLVRSGGTDLTVDLGFIVVGVAAVVGCRRLSPATGRSTVLKSIQKNIPVVLRKGLKNGSLVEQVDATLLETLDRCAKSTNTIIADVFERQNLHGQPSFPRELTETADQLMRTALAVTIRPILMHVPPRESSLVELAEIEATLATLCDSTHSSSSPERDEELSDRIASAKALIEVQNNVVSIGE